MLTDDELLEVIYDAMWEAKNIAAWAESHGIARQNLNATLLGKRAPCPQIAAAVGYKKIILSHPNGDGHMWQSITEV